MESVKTWGKRHWYTTLLTVALIAVAVWGLAQYRYRIETRNQLENSYQRSFYDLVGSVENIDVLIAKGLVSTSPRENILLLSNTWKEASSAQDKLNQLPLNHALIARTTKFINQTGDFSYALAHQLADGQDLSGEQRASLQNLQREADYLVRELHALRTQIAENRFAWGEISRQGTGKFKQVSPSVSEVSFRRIDTEMQGMPTLIYDGPFSDHVDRVTPRGVSGSEISEEQAAKIAMEKVDLMPGVQYTTRQVGTVEGKIPAYRIEIAAADNRSAENIVVDISRTGGHLIEYLNSRPLAAGTIDRAQVEARASEYLKKKNFPNLIATYTQVDDASATISYAGYENGVVLYPDLVKVKVALDNGQIIGVDNLGYLMSHYDRQLPAPKVKESEVRGRAATTVKVERIRLALIPFDSKREVLCYEVKGVAGEEDYYLYFNVEDGNQEKILKVIKTEQGPLTM
ncbi:MAG: germination protein YpeB [Syntrophomonadaceae bacterium]|nr:germination protein YpeB [Syntrophomonadaceae bacterium]